MAPPSGQAISDQQHSGYRKAKGDKGSSLEFFILTNRIANCVDKTEVDCNSSLASHRPVTVTFCAQLTSLGVQHLQRPPQINTGEVTGPQFRAQGWQLNIDRAKSFNGVSKSSLDRDSALVLVGVGPRDSADLAEQELCANTASIVTKYRIRGRKPTTKWRTIITKSP